MRGIIFSADSIRALEGGRKTQTRRIIDPQPFRDDATFTDGWRYERGRAFAEWAGCVPNPESILQFCPYGQPGDVLYVKEIRPHWKSPRFMPEKFARFHIRLTNVRVERLQEISNEDAWEEGMLADTPRDEFQTIWNALNARRGHSWENNPYVWVLEFELVDSL